MNQPSYCLPLIEHLYYHYLQLYQERYQQNTTFTVTWRHISFWRKHVTLYGRQLVEAGWLYKEDYLAQKNTVLPPAQSCCIHTIKTQISL